MATSQHQHGKSGSGGNYGGGQQKGGHSENLEPKVADKPFSQWSNDLKKWISEKIGKDTIVFAEGTGKLLKNEGLTTSQIRNIFGEMRKIQLNGFEKEKANFLLLRAKLAYTTRRQGAEGLEKFYQMFCWGYDEVNIDSTDAKNQYDRFLQVMEAVLAYHKFYGGK